MLGGFLTLSPGVSSERRIRIHVVDLGEDLRKQQLEWGVRREREGAGVELLNELLSSSLLWTNDTGSWQCGHGHHHLETKQS